MVKVLLTGGNGFIGSFLKDRFEEEGISYFSLTREKGDVADLQTWDNLPEVEYVIHLAGQNYVPESWKRSSDYLQTNIVGTNNALEYASKCNAKLIYISAYLYGKPECLPIKESHKISPNNPYALSKHLAEQVCQFRATYFKQNITVLRLFNVYGYNQRKEFLIPSLIQQILHNTEIKVFDLAPKRDYIFIEDVVDAILRATKLPDGFNIINVGSGLSHSVQEVIDQLQSIAETKLPIKSECIIRQEEISDVVADISLAKNILGWIPKWSLEKGLEKIFSQGLVHMQKIKK